MSGSVVYPATLGKAADRHRFARSRWVALGFVLALLLGAGGMNVASGMVSTGAKPVFVAVTPQRIADTRVDVGINGRLASGQPKVLKVTGSVPVAPSGVATVVPDGATSVALNVTVVGPTRAGYLSVRPGNPAGHPTTSSLNFAAGSTVPNAVTVSLPTAGGDAGKIQLWYQGSDAQGRTHAVVDVVGYYEDHDHDDRYYTKAQINGLPSSSVVAGGGVTAAGAITTSVPRFGTAWSVTRPFSGIYSVTMPGLNPGCLDPLMPLTIVESFTNSVGFQQAIGFASVSCASGDTTVQINTYNAAGVATDRAFQFIAYRPGNNQILPASEHPGAKECTVHSDGVVECT
jgi:hypothetical protein